MLKQLLEIGSQAADLSIKNQQLMIDLKSGETLQRPVEDIGVLVLDHPGLRYSHQTLIKLIENNVCVLLSDRSHLPVSMLFHIEQNSLQAKRFNTQINAKKPLQKQLWASIVKSKIKRQGRLLSHLHGSDFTLFAIAQEVKSGDTSNRESYASRLYWKYLFGEIDFRRNRDAKDINMGLNYGYIVIRSAIARAIAATGLHPSIGIHHSNQYNAYALADDLIEPLRPLVDEECYSLMEEFGPIDELTRDIRARLLNLLNRTLVVNSLKYPFLEAVNQYVYSLYDSFESNENRLQVPEWY